MRNVAIFTVVLAFTVGCSKSDDNNNPANTTANNTANNTAQTIGPDGGELSLADGTSVAIGEGALSEDVEIAVSSLSSAQASELAATLDSGLELVSDLYAFTPHGTSFSTAVDIEIPFDSSSTQLFVVRLDDEDDTTWEQLAGATFSAGVASFTTTSFSIMGIAAQAGVVANNDAGPADMGGGDSGGNDMGGNDSGGGDMAADMGGDMGMVSNYANLPGTWTVTQGLGRFSTEPAVAINGNGDAVVAWPWGQSNDFRLYISEFTSGAWTHPADAMDAVVMTLPARWGSETSVGLTDAGDATIVNHGRISSGAAVFRSTRTQGVWSHPMVEADRVDFPLEVDDHFASTTHVAVAPDGTGLHAWHWLNTGIYGALGGAGGIWSMPNDVVADALNVAGTWTAMSPNSLNAGAANGGHAIVAFQQQGPNGIFVNVSQYSNAQWTRGTEISTVAANRNDPVHAAVAPNGDAIVVFTSQTAWDGCGSCTALFVSEYTNGVWTHPVDGTDFLNASGPEFNRVSNTISEPIVEMLDNGDAIVIYDQFVNGQDEIFIAERVNGVWNVPGPTEFVPSIAAPNTPPNWGAAIGPTGDIVVAQHSVQVGPFVLVDLQHRIDGVWYLPAAGEQTKLSETAIGRPFLDMNANGDVVLATAADDAMTVAYFEKN